MRTLPLESFHHSLGAQFIEFAEWSIPADYGDPDTEYHSLAGGAGFVDLSFRDLISVTGEDRVRFLNGQTTNDVAALRPGRAVYSAFANAKGKMRADGTILALQESFLIDTEPGRGPALIEELGKFVIADDVELSAATRARFAVMGPKASDVLRAMAMPTPAEINQFEISDDTWVLRAFWGPDTRFEIFAPAARSEEIARRAVQSAAPTGWLALETRRIELGIPRFGSDADMDENTLPPEAGIETRAVSYTKGCYIGQEVISRIKSVGHVNRLLMRLAFEDLQHPLHRGEKLLLDEGEAGMITSCARVPAKGWRGLGYVRSGAFRAEGPRGPGSSGRLKAGGFDVTVL